MRNSQHILEVFGSFISKPFPFDLHLLGGAALDLVYGIARFSEDVDMICTLREGKL